MKTYHCIQSKQKSKVRKNQIALYVSVVSFFKQYPYFLIDTELSHWVNLYLFVRTFILLPPETVRYIQWGQ